MKRAELQEVVDRMMVKGGWYLLSPYERALAQVVCYGQPREDRTGVGTVSMFGLQTRYDLRSTFPLITSKRVFWRGVVEELLWFLRGETNIKSLQEAGVSIWDEWANENGDLGPVYGKQWRSWSEVRLFVSNMENPHDAGGFLKGGYKCVANDTQDDIHDIVIGRRHIDQIAAVVKEIQTNPYSRRLIVSAWNVAELDRMALPPCHCLFQFYVHDGLLSCQLYQRSADMFLGVPFNIASYAALTHLIARWSGLRGVNEFIHTIGDAHIYANHFEQVAEQLSRSGRSLPTLRISPTVRPMEIPTFEQFVLNDYDPHPAIKGRVAV